MKLNISFKNITKMFILGTVLYSAQSFAIEKERCDAIKGVWHEVTATTEAYCTLGKVHHVGKGDIPVDKAQPSPKPGPTEDIARLGGPRPIKPDVSTGEPVPVPSVNPRPHGTLPPPPNARASRPCPSYVGDPCEGATGTHHDGYSVKQPPPWEDEPDGAKDKASKPPPWVTPTFPDESKVNQPPLPIILYINMNKSSESDLASFSGIGAETARLIVLLRTQKPFANAQDFAERVCSQASIDTGFESRVAIATQQFSPRGGEPKAAGFKCAMGENTYEASGKRHKYVGHVTLLR